MLPSYRTHESPYETSLKESTRIELELRKIPSMANAAKAVEPSKKEQLMKKLVLALGLAALAQVCPSYAQLAPVNEMGLSIGHMHVFPADREKEARAWLALGGQLGNNLSNNIPIGFPGIVILIGNARQGNLGSVGSVIDHVAFRVPDLQASLKKWNGVQTWWKN